MAKTFGHFFANKSGKKACLDFLEKGAVIFADFYRDFPEYKADFGLRESSMQVKAQIVEMQKMHESAHQQIQNIKNICANEIDCFMNLFKSELILQFLQYARHELGADADRADVGQFNVRKQLERQIVIDKLLAEINFGLTAKIKAWLNGRGNYLHSQAVAKIQAKLDRWLKSNASYFALVPHSLEMSGAAPFSAPIQLADDDNKIFVTGGLMAGSGMAGLAAALFLPARFLLVAGPLGWIINGLLTVLGAGLAAWSGRKQLNLLVEACIAEARSMIIKNSSEWAAEIALAAANKLGASLLPFLNAHEQGINRQQRQEELALLQKSMQNLRIAQALIKSYAIKFQNLQQEWALLIADDAQNNFQLKDRAKQDWLFRQARD